MTQRDNSIVPKIEQAKFKKQKLKRPTWSIWQKDRRVFLRDAIALSMNVAPTSVHLLQRDNIQFARAYRNRLGRAYKETVTTGDGILIGKIVVISEGTNKDEANPIVDMASFVAFAQKTWSRLPVDFIKLGEKNGQTDDGTGRQQADRGDLTDWHSKARKIADECFDDDTKANVRDSLKGYAKRVMEIMQERELHGPRGQIDNPNTIQRDALQSNKWWKNKPK